MPRHPMYDKIHYKFKKKKILKKKKTKTKEKKKKRMPRQPFLIEGYDNLWALDIGLLGGNQVSLIRVLPFH